MGLGVRNVTRALPPPAFARWRARLAPLVMLLAATMLFALGPAVLKLLTTRGAELGFAKTAVSFCNVLFIGNFCAGIVTLSFAGPRRVRRELVSMPRRVQGLLVLAAIVSAIYPSLLFTALEQTSVTNVVLLSRFNGIVYVFLGFLFFRDRLRLPESIGYGLVGLGVGVLIVTNNDGLHIRRGDALVLLATLFFAFTEILSRQILPHVSIRTYVFFRNFVSSILFFVVAMSYFGPKHFMDTFMGDLWLLMVAYSVFAIVFAQILWLRSVPLVAAKVVANTQMLNPVFTIFFAFVLLGEVPMSMQWIVIAVLAAGVILPRFWPDPRAREPVRPIAIDTSLVGK